MKLLFKQRMISWFDSYDVYNEEDERVFVIKGQVSLTRRLKIYDGDKENHLGTLREEMVSLLPKYHVEINDEDLGCIKRKVSVWKPKYNIEFKDWEVKGNIWEWDYEIEDRDGNLIAAVSKKLFHLTDTYEIDVKNEKDALPVLMLVLAIDADKQEAEDKEEKKNKRKKDRD